MSEMKGIDDIVAGALAGVQKWADHLSQSAKGAESAAQALVAKAREQVESFKEYTEDIKTGRLFQAEKFLVDEVDFDEAAKYRQGSEGMPVTEIRLVFPGASLDQIIYHGGDENFKFKGRYRVLVVFQKLAPKKKGD
jgi:hypothetical protein